MGCRRKQSPNHSHGAVAPKKYHHAATTKYGRSAATNYDRVAVTEGSRGIHSTVVRSKFFRRVATTEKSVDNKAITG
ncbi:MAG: hypothetical protein JWL81_2006 [Verrucomicrobiales bacterium]|nr:hypothetical protein [Verrucomicrobiales bacterium]